MHIDEDELTDAIIIYINSMSDSEKDDTLFDYIKEYINDNLNESEQYHFCKYAEFS